MKTLSNFDLFWDVNLSFLLCKFFILIFHFFPTHCPPPGHSYHNPSLIPPTSFSSLSGWEPSRYPPTWALQASARLCAPSHTETKQGSPASRTYSPYRQQTAFGITPVPVGESLFLNERQVLEKCFFKNYDLLHLTKYYLKLFEHIKDKSKYNKLPKDV